VLTATAPTKIAIDARVIPGRGAGVATAVKSLIQGLGELDDGTEEYRIVVATEEQRAWLKPVLGANQQVIIKPKPRQNPLTRVLPPLRPLVRYLQRGLATRSWPEVPISDGFYEGLGCDVLHLPAQAFILCALPTVYNPHDLQHLRYPQFFDAWTLAWRETIYPAGCHFAQCVVVGSEWVKQDVIDRYGIDPAKIQVIPEAAPTAICPEPSADVLTQIQKKYQLDIPFMLYPAVTWPHKNHRQLFDALAHLRDAQGQSIRLVCTGARYEPSWPALEARIRELKLGDHVRFLGYVPEEDLRGLYRLARCVVMPSLYEASSLPVFEAWLDGTPVACSNATALPQQVLDAALLFDPRDVRSVAEAVAKLMNDSEARSDFRARGYERIKEFDLLRTAKAYRAVYRRTADLPLGDEDRWLLKWDWMRKPERHGNAGQRSGGSAIQ
jgi:glycosyltransferase involved in cell wall biosynthesis